MPRFLSRAGTNIDDLERQLARVGSAENDEASSHNMHTDDEGSAGSDSGNSNAPDTPRHAAGENTPLLSAYSSHQRSPAPGSPQYAYVSPQPQQKQHKHRHSHGHGHGRKHRHSGGNRSSNEQASMPATAAAAASVVFSPAATASAPRKLGTWDGVFLPVTLSIWGILVYVRMGFFLGQIGIVGTIGSFVCGYLVTTMTTLSISAISTNGTVKGGGPYYMLSRSLGPEFGGSIGLMFYAGTLLSGVLNAVAFVEPLLSNFGRLDGDLARVFPEGVYWRILYSSLLLIFCTTVCLTGAQMFAKASTALSTLIIASTLMVLVSFVFRAPFENPEKAVYYTGWSMQTLRENLWPELGPIAEGRPSETFGTVLGVLFPACIGIMAGASMSSALRKPSKSIPKGTLWAILLTFTLYMAIIVCLGATTRRQTLRLNFNVLQEINVLPLVVPLGAITTSVTSTLSGVLSSASVLQAIAKDDLFACLKWFKKVDPQDNPLRAILATYLLSQLAFLMGDTNAVAPYATVFNLIMFAFVNFACLVLKLAASVNFRPTFHYFKAWTAFLGATGCFAIMLVVDRVSAMLSTGMVVVLFLYVHYTCAPKPWGDVTQSLIYHQCRKFMLRLDVRKEHVKFWRPQILLLVHNPRSSLQLIRFCNALKKGGLYVIGHVLKGGFYEMLPEMQQQESLWLRLIDVLGVKAFLNLAVEEREDAGARALVLGAGLGGMRPNIVVMGFLNLGRGGGKLPDACGDVALPTDGIRLNSPIAPTAYVRIIEDVLVMGKAVGIAYGFAGLDCLTPTPLARGLQGSSTPLHGSSGGLPHYTPSSSKRYIDLWPIQIGTLATASGTSAHQQQQPQQHLTNFSSYVMVLQLGTVLHLVPHWHKHYVLRVMCFVENAGDVEEEHRRVAKLLRDLRVVAELHVFSLRGARLESYELAVAEGSSLPAQAQAQAQTETQAQAETPVRVPRNSVRRAAAAAGMSRSLGRAGGRGALGGFSVRVKLPMPLRYEHKGAGYDGGHSGSSSESTSSQCSSSSSSSSESEPSGENGVLGLPRFSTVAGLPRGSRWLRRLSGGPRQADEEEEEEEGDGTARPASRRRSDGSLVLSRIYARALASGAATATAAATADQEVPPAPPVGHGPAEFNDMPVGTQNRILNELIRRQSAQGATALIFTTLQAPEPGTADSEARALEYLEDIESLARGLPPVFLVHATSLTVTTSL
ncbi:hypothetical protein LPJ53_000763 [Coemansia erecta]|uniref:Amino acid permease/ SLC12A domain-containing protein n=1 Tax=Coemansia erecta TaxID=147472 RepID=A0A9W8CVM4_9FUNG|nr:hypothetical protein LPJ53_000763 [Coemansia erecta]